MQRSKEKRILEIKSGPISFKEERQKILFGGDGDFEARRKIAKEMVSSPNILNKNEKAAQHLNILEKSGKSLGAFDQKISNEWRLISLAVDSGACTTVADPESVPNYLVTETAASRAGENFTGAGGEEIPNLGGMAVPIYTREGSQRLLSITAAPVTKPLLSVKQLNRTGHLVVFDGPDSCIVNKTSGEVNMLREEDGNYILDVWVPPNSDAGFTRQS